MAAYYLVSNIWRFVLMAILLAVTLSGSTRAVEIAVLTPETWDEFAPQGKEVDCIYGDYVLRNKNLVAVIARPVKGRNANMTVKNVGGMLIDFTTRKNQNDQLSAYYIGASRFQFTSPDSVEIIGVEDKNKVRQAGRLISLSCTSDAVEGQPQLTVSYALSDESVALGVDAMYENPHNKPIEVELYDAIRADRVFSLSVWDDSGLLAHDDWFRQAYFFGVEEHKVRRGSGTRGSILEFLHKGEMKVKLEPGMSHEVSMYLDVASDVLSLKGIHADLAISTSIHVSDPAGPVNNAKVTLAKGKVEYGSARTGADGKLAFKLDKGGIHSPRFGTWPAAENIHDQPEEVTGIQNRNGSVWLCRRRHHRPRGQTHSLQGSVLS